MTQGEKELLLKDLSARLSYRVKYMSILNPDEPPLTLQSIDKCGLVMASNGESFEIESVKSYLFPILSMIEERRKDFENTTIRDNNCTIWTARTYDWFDANHIDYRGLIPMNLANDATGLNIY